MERWLKITKVDLNKRLIYPMDLHNKCSDISRLKGRVGISLDSIFESVAIAHKISSAQTDKYVHLARIYVRSDIYSLLRERGWLEVKDIEKTSAYKVGWKKGILYVETDRGSVPVAIVERIDNKIVPY